MKDEIIKKYSNKNLGNQSYGKNAVYYVKDFSDIGRLSHIIAETYTSESSINRDGVSFLKEYYGFSNLAKILEEKGGVDGDLMDSISIIDWLNILEQEASQDIL